MRSSSMLALSPSSVHIPEPRPDRTAATRPFAPAVDELSRNWHISRLFGAINSALEGGGCGPTRAGVPLQRAAKPRSGTDIHGRWSDGRS